jgi:SAM-dependent methyltransferase
VAIFSLPTLQHEWFQYVDRVSRRTLGVSDLSGPRLVRAVAHVSQLYTRERAQLTDLQGDDDALCARLKFFLSRDLAKVHGPIAELASVRAFPARRQLRVLDVGAGLGATSLGLSRSLRALDLADRVELTAIDVDDAALEILAELCADLTPLPGVPIDATCRVTDVSRGLPLARGARFDVILLGLSLNELNLASGSGTDAVRDAVARLSSLASHLSDDGVLLVIEPALRETSRTLHAIRDVLATRTEPPFVFAPCLHRTIGCPMLRRERDFCHERVPCALPEPLATLARGAGLRDTDLTYSYLTLHRAPRSLLELERSSETSERLDDHQPSAPAHHPRDEALATGTLLRAVSGSLPTKGKIELWLCGETIAPRAMRLGRHASDENAAYELAERGSVLRIEPADCGEDGSRLRIGATTRVDLVQHWQAGPGDDAVAES